MKRLRGALSEPPNGGGSAVAWGVSPRSSARLTDVSSEPPNGGGSAVAWGVSPRSSVGLTNVFSEPPAGGGSAIAWGVSPRNDAARQIINLRAHTGRSSPFAVAKGEDRAGRARRGEGRAGFVRRLPIPGECAPGYGLSPLRGFNTAAFASKPPR